MTTIQLYSNKSQENVVDKNIELVATLKGNFRRSVNLDTPSITIQNTKFYSYNYCYIVDLGLYYYIDNITIINNKCIELSLREDVLMSHKGYIKTIECIVARNEYDYNEYLADEEIATTIDVTNDYDVVMDSPFLNSMDRDIYPYNIVVLVGGSQ